MDSTEYSLSRYRPHKEVHVLDVARPEWRGKVAPVWCLQLQSGHIAQCILGGINDLLWLRFRRQIILQTTKACVQRYATNACTDGEICNQ